MQRKSLQKRCLRDGGKALAVVRGRTMDAQCFHMFLRSISLVAVPPELGMIARRFNHQPVAPFLGDDSSCAYFLVGQFRVFVKIEKQGFELIIIISSDSGLQFRRRRTILRRSR